MHGLKVSLLTISLVTLIASCSKSQETRKSITKEMKGRIVKTDEEWKKELSKEEYYVLRQKGTERAFTGKLWNNHEEGIYYCAACHEKLFSSKTKFESGTGWPSFFEPINEESIAINKDTAFGMLREEVVCSRCDGHLGHVFPDGPEPTGLRYCLNSVSLVFEKE
jgi:peptide-methionine (R)-S-oxide reductase